MSKFLLKRSAASPLETGISKKLSVKEKQGVIAKMAETTVDAFFNQKLLDYVKASFALSNQDTEPSNKYFSLNLLEVIAADCCMLLNAGLMTKDDFDPAIYDDVQKHVAERLKAVSDQFKGLAQSSLQSVIGDDPERLDTSKIYKFVIVNNDLSVIVKNYAIKDVRRTSHALLAGYKNASPGELRFTYDAINKHLRILYNLDSGRYHSKRLLSSNQLSEQPGDQERKQYLEDRMSKITKHLKTYYQSQGIKLEIEAVWNATKFQDNTPSPELA